MKNRINLAGLVILSVLLLATTTGHAEIFTVELPEFLGPLDEETYMKTTSFDFGTSFAEIYDVRIQLEGTFTPGLAHGDGTWFPEDEWTDVPGIFDLYMDPGDGVCVAGGLVYEDPLLIEESFNLHFDATWDFLLDGTDEVTFMYTWGFAIEGWIIVTDPTAAISEAYLIVDGVVPEPATVLLVGLGVIWIQRARRRG